MKDILIINEMLFVSKSWLRSFNLPTNTIDSWACKHGREYRNGVAFICFDDIPALTILNKKLPAKSCLLASVKENDFDAEIEKHKAAFLKAKTTDFIQYREQYKDIPCLTDEKVRAAAQRFAYWVYIERLTKEGCRDVAKLNKALCTIEPNLYKSYAVFNNKKAQVMKDGIFTALFDNRWITSQHNVKKVSVLNQFWVTSLLSIGKKYSNSQVWDKLCSLCAGANEKAPSKSWVDKFRQEILRKNIDINESRNGKDDAGAKQLSFASIQHALHANSQWQMDGWQLPFYVDGFKRYVIVIVRDAYSKKIIGSAVGESENTIVIMAALRDAIMNTGYLPFEILTDNHAWNKTKEAHSFKEIAAAIGTQYTVTHSPTHKAIIERYNQHLGSLCKDYFGYTGEGIKSKNVNARPKQENLDTYGKQPVTESEVMLIGAKVVYDFNSRLLTKENKSPNQLYEESEKPHCFAVDVFQRIRLLTAKTELKVNRGQITITRGGKKYEYQIPADLFSTYNNQTVIVRYEDLNEAVYLYSHDTDKPITQLQTKVKIHGAKADQNEEDIKHFNQNAGRIKGIKRRAKKENEELTRKALEANPEAFVLLNRVTTPKNILKEFEEKAELRRLAEEKGINLHTVLIPERDNELDNESLMPAKKVNESPYKPKNHVLRKLSREDFIEE